MSLNPASILHVVPDLDPVNGGTVAAVAGLAIAQKNRGWRVEVVTVVGSKSDSRVIRQLESEGVSVRSVSAASRVSMARTLAGKAAQHVAKFDCVHIHALWEELQHQYARAASKRRVPFIIAPHGMLDPWSLSQRRWKKRIYLRLRLRKTIELAHSLHCTTMTESQLLHPLQLSTPSVVVPNGIQSEEFEIAKVDEAAQQFRLKYQSVAGRKVVLFLSRLHPKKGLDLLLIAFAESKLSDTLLLLAGPGEPAYIAWLREQANNLGISDRVIFTGMLHGSERVGALGVADLFVLPSYQENFGIAVVESLAAGTPVIISDQVNLCRELETAGIGQVLENKVTHWSSALERWLGDTDLLRRQQTWSREFARQFDFNSVAEHWEQVWGEILRSRNLHG